MDFELRKSNRISGNLINLKLIDASSFDQCWIDYSLFITAN